MRAGWKDLFEELLHAEREADVTAILTRRRLLDEALWVPLGREENNYSVVGVQHADPTGALVEKVINGIDALLLRACYASGIDPESERAPQSMAEAVELFFGVKGGRLGDLTPREQTALAMNLRLIAVGLKTDPSYLVVDTGEGQTPRSFPDTFMSLVKSNKLRIPFVQGKYNAGGTGVLPFCGTENYQLIASRRQPEAPAAPEDDTRDLWGFTLIRRIRPTAHDKRRTSMYVYLAPDENVPSFASDAITVLPRDRQKGPATPYAEPLEYGTVIKLYNYGWRAKSVATTEARFELERYLHSPCLPFRVTETRDYKANYFSTTVSGIWAAITTDEAREEREQVESDFPASARLNLRSTGELPYQIVVWKPERDIRRLPHGVAFTVNGQVHGEAPADFVSRRLEFDYLRNQLFVSVDCTNMKEEVREDFFMASRDRMRNTEVRTEVLAALQSDLKNHPGLKALNAARRAREVEKALGEQEDVVDTLQQLLKLDPGLRSLFETGERLVTTVAPTETEKFEGRRWPTYFRIAKEPTGLVKQCPVNLTCRVEFETDAENSYFERPNQPGKIWITPADACEYQRLWNGVFSTRFRPPKGAKPGDRIEVTVGVTDPDRESRGKQPFWCTFVMLVTPTEDRTSRPGTTTKPKKPNEGEQEAPRLAVPTITDVRRPQWGDHEPPFTEDDALRIKNNGEGGYDFFLNLDNRYLVNELSRVSTKPDKDLAVYWFRWGLAFCAMALIRHLAQVKPSANGETPGVPDSDGQAEGFDVAAFVNQSTGGIASVIVPVIRSLNRGPAPAPA
ncbi:MAG: hypothetical protein ACRDHS_04895 [Actinomycetota bacterium]